MFGSLSLDLLLHIFNFMDLGSIVALRKTSKLFCCVTSQRIIWVDLLRRVCSDNSVFRPTFPIDQMCVTDLERAVFAPTRWLDHVMRNNMKARGCCARTITPSENPYFQGVYLVPGGRFLITFSEADLCVWDLGYSSSTILKNTPIASASHIFNDIFAVVPTADGLGLRIFANTICETNGWTDEESIRDEFWIFEIFPLSEKPKLSKIASLLVEDYSDVSLFVLRGDLLIYHGANYVKVWNFVTGTGVTFNVGDESYEQLSATDEFVVLIQFAVVSVWNIPPLVPGGHIEEPGADHVKPDLELPVECDMDIDSLEGDEELQFEMPSEWYTHHPITYDVIHQSSESRTIWRYEVILPEGRVKLRHKFILPKEGSAAMIVEPYRFCDGTLVMSWSNCQSLMASCTPRGPQEKDDFRKPEDVTLLCDEAGLERVEFTLCPVAGRLCHISCTQGSIVIFDYLASPAS